jgi:hypothetical protein
MNTSQEIIAAHKNLQHAISEFDRYKRGVATMTYCLREAAQRVEACRSAVPVDSTESTDKANYIAAAEAHLAECLKGTATNSPRPANYTPGMYAPKPELPQGGAPQNPGKTVDVTKGSGGLQKF